MGGRRGGEPELPELLFRIRHARDLPTSTCWTRRVSRKAKFQLGSNHARTILYQYRIKCIPAALCLALQSMRPVLTSSMELQLTSHVRCVRVCLSLPVATDPQHRVHQALARVSDTLIRGFCSYVYVSADSPRQYSPTKAGLLFSRACAPLPHAPVHLSNINHCIFLLQLASYVTQLIFLPISTDGQFHAGHSR